MRFLLVRLVALAMAGCVTGEKAQGLKIGMDRQAAVKIMGRPGGDRVEDNSGALGWSKKLMSGWSWDRADYSVVLTDGKVTAYGVGTVRQDTTHGLSTLVIIPVGH